MLKNPDHVVIKKMAVNLLFSMHVTPEAKQTVCQELLPIADFRNGLMRPNSFPPFSVEIVLDGERWLFSKKNNRWKNVGTA